MARRVVRLVGGITAVVERIESDDGEVVVRKRYPAGDPEAAELVERDAAALLALAGSDIPAPRLIRAEPTGEPTIVMSYLPGRPKPGELRPAALAAMQARIHTLPAALDAETAGWFDPDRDLPWIADNGLRRDALAAAAAASSDRVFVHGDFQPFNVLFTGDSISGVVDWTMAGTGPRGVDVGHCLLNLAVLGAADVADAYLVAYERFAGAAVDPGSLVRALLCWSRDWERFIPIQLAGRASVDVDGMAQRVTETIRRRLA